MHFFRSLKYRIAVTIFILEAILLSVVLWHTQTLAYEQTKSEIETQDHVILDLLSQASSHALEEPDSNYLAPFIEQASSSDNVQHISLVTTDSNVVASSDPGLIGSYLKPQEATHNTYWRERSIQKNGNDLGNLYVLFSSERLLNSYEDRITQGIYIALIGMLIIAVIGIIMGHLLTQRLEKIIEQTSSYTHGEGIKHINDKGNDELSVLAKSLNLMIDKINHSMREMEHLAYHDPLTGLANRRNYDSRLTHALDSAKSKGHTHCLMLLDIDHFKNVNDTCGHDAGDQLLVEIAQNLTGALRVRDTLVRLGGDEFALLIERAETDDMKVLAEKLRKIVHEYRLEFDDRHLSVSVSIGVVMITEDSYSIQQIMKAADDACYLAKKNGRNTVFCRDWEKDGSHLTQKQLRINI